jgi:hypothetical protein
MPGFQLVAHPQFSPTSCVTCGANRDDIGFIDLLADTATMGFDNDGVPIDDPHGVKPTIGHLYLCATCLFQAATAAGCAEPAAKALTAAQIETLEAENAWLAAEVEREQQNKLVSLDDVRKLIAAGTNTAKAS